MNYNLIKAKIEYININYLIIIDLIKLYGI